MPFRPCPTGCGRFLSADDGHDRCLQCLGRRHAEAAFVDDSCVCCGRMSMISLRSRLSLIKGLAPSAATRADLSGSSRGSRADALGDLRVTVRASLPGTPPRTSYSSRSEHPVRFPGDFAGLSHGAPSISCGAPSVDRMSIAASGDGFTSSRWLTCTIRLGYAIQFTRRPPKFNGVLETSVAVRNAPVLREEIAVLLAKDAIEPVPPAEMRQGFYSPYFIVPKKGGGLRPILDLRVLNRALHKLPFKMLTHRRMIKCIQPQDWFAAIDLKDAYFHVSILPRHRPFLRFAFEGRAWQYRVLPFGLSLSPRVFTKVVEGALTPLREVGVRILNYLDDWLILAQSREQLGDHRDLVLRHLSQLGLRVNWEKSKLSPVQRISFLGVELDSVSMTARLTEERAQAVLNCLSSVRGGKVVPLKQFQRLLGHMASAAAVTPLGLLHMRPLQHWLHSRVPRWAWRRGTLRVGISQQCRRSLSPWTDLAFLRAGVPLEQVSRHTVVTTDASSTGWGATCNGQAASGLWTGPRLLWHINCLELWAVHLALRQFRPLLLGKHVLVRTDNTAAVSYINRLGVYDHTACHSSPAISSSGVTRSSSHCVLFTSRGSSIVRPTRSHDSSRSPENGDSIPRRSGWSGVDSGKLR